MLFEVHQKISEEIGMSKAMNPESEVDFTRGHRNGLKEANNRVEELIYEILKE
jgi:hypothetical protein